MCIRDRFFTGVATTFGAGGATYAQVDSEAFAVGSDAPTAFTARARYLRPFSRPTGTFSTVQTATLPDGAQLATTPPPSFKISTPLTPGCEFCELNVTVRVTLVELATVAAMPEGARGTPSASSSMVPVPVRFLSLIHI